MVLTRHLGLHLLKVQKRVDISDGKVGAHGRYFRSLKCEIEAEAEAET